MGEGERRLELEGTDSAGARNAGESWKDTGLQQLELAEASKGPGAGDIEGPQGLGDRKQRPPPTRDQKGAQVITQRNEWRKRYGGVAKEEPRDGRGTNPFPSPNP